MFARHGREVKIQYVADVASLLRSDPPFFPSHGCTISRRGRGRTQTAHGSRRTRAGQEAKRDYRRTNWRRIDEGGEGRPETGPHGPIARRFIGKPKEALAWVRTEKAGFAADAILHPALGGI